MKSVFSQKPCDTCCVDSQVGNPYNWERECDRCIKLGQWKNEALIRLSKIEDILGDEYDLDRLKELVQADREGKCVLFKEFGGVDAIPLCVRSKDVDDIVNTVRLLAGSFGGVNLEDISAPRCFEIEKKLRDMTKMDLIGSFHRKRLAKPYSSPVRKPKLHWKR